MSLLILGMSKRLVVTGRERQHFWKGLAYLWLQKRTDLEMKETVEEFWKRTSQPSYLFLVPLLCCLPYSSKVLHQDFESTPLPAPIQGM